MPQTTSAPGLSRSQRGLLAVMASPRRLWRFLRDPKAPRSPKVVAVLALAYVIWPADLVPDLVPLLGWLDDLGVAGMALAWVSSQAAQHEAAGGEAIGVRPVSG